MIRAIEIENFKCIGERQRIEFAPITLLFGPNSAGKSTVIQALLYAHDILWENDLNAGSNTKGGIFVNLGGFENFVHQRETSRPICLKFEIPYTSAVSALETTYHDYNDRLCQGLDYDHFSLREGAYGVEVDMSWNDNLGMPTISRYDISLNGVWIATAEATDQVDIVSLRRINWIHPNFLQDEEELIQTICEINKDRERRGFQKIEIREFCNSAQGFSRDLVGNLPSESIKGTQLFVAGVPATLNDLSSLEWKLVSRFLSRFTVALGDKTIVANDGSIVLSIKDPLRIRIYPSGSRVGPLDLIEFNGHNIDGMNAERIAIRRNLTDLFLIPLNRLASELHDLVYIGPLRAIPFKHFHLQRAAWIHRRRKDLEDWSDRKYAWAGLQCQWDQFIEEVSDWMSRSDRLSTGYGLRAINESRQSAYASDDQGELEPEPVEYVFFDCSSHLELFPADVGVGLSQLVPVVTAAVGCGSNIVCIEQPELHVHPRVQVGLGDLFIDSFVRKQPNTMLAPCGQCILETHSEHLLLRLLRRVRETCTRSADPGQFSLTPTDLAVYYAERLTTGSKFRRLVVDEDGDFADDWPRGFFEERSQELF